MISWAGESPWVRRWGWWAPLMFKHLLGEMMRRDCPLVTGFPTELFRAGPSFVWDPLGAGGPLSVFASAWPRQGAVMTARVCSDASANHDPMGTMPARVSFAVEAGGLDWD